MLRQCARTNPPQTHGVGDVVALSKSCCNENVAEACYITCKVKEISAPRYYKLYSPHGLIKGSHQSSLLFSLPHDTWSNYPITSTGKMISMATAARLYSLSPTSLDPPHTCRAACSCRKSYTGRCSCHWAKQLCYSLCHKKDGRGCGDKDEVKEGGEANISSSDLDRRRTREHGRQQKRQRRT